MRISRFSIPNQELDQVALEAYNDFYKRNKTLLDENPREYQHQVRLYVEERKQKYKVKKFGTSNKNSQIITD